MNTPLKRFIKYLRFYGGYRHCNICNKPVRRFFPFSESLQQDAKSAGFSYDFRRMETLNLNNCNCPFCMSSDRERLYMLFLNDLFESKQSNFNILDFAPTEAFSIALKAKQFVTYTSADLMKQNVDQQIDICNMNHVQDSVYDILICSHILEHVDSPEKALREIYRVLKPGGFAIVMVPLFWDVVETLENPEYNTPFLRCKYYGQSDHVRLFARADFMARLKHAGFQLQQFTFSSFEKKKVKQYAIAENSILYICNKNE